MENKDQKRIEEEVDKTLALLRGLDHPTAGDDFYGRVKAKLGNTGQEATNQNQTEQEVDKTLALLGNLEHPTASDDFYDRVQAKLANTDEETTNVKPLNPIRHFYWAAAVIAVLLVNSATLLSAYGSEETTISRDDQIESLIEDYSLRTESPYNV
jgi:hypothetical protein